MTKSSGGEPGPRGRPERTPRDVERPPPRPRTSSTPGTRDAAVLAPEGVPRRSTSGGAVERLSPGAEVPSGTVLGGYRILSELGRGGMGIVYRAEDLRRGGTVALKTLLWGDPSAMLRFKNEFRAIADVTHENLAALYELASDDGRLFFTMELIEGVDFLEWVKADPARLRPTLTQLARGLDALHAADRIHRDLKPSNVLVDREGRVVVLDFGLAATLSKEGAHQSTQHRAIGTPAYMAPEQALGKPVTASCDWYSVGVMLYEALTGRVPFEGSGVEILVGKQRATPRPPSSLAPDVPEQLDALCAALLHREPDRRPGRDEVLRALHADVPVAAATDRRAVDGSTATIVGRERHIRVLQGALDALRGRQPVVVFVHGNSGMGKTTILQRFLDEVRDRGDGVVLHGKCYERESVPYKALDVPIDMLARYLGRLPRAEAEALLPRDVHSIARVFPVLRRVGAIAQAPQPQVLVQDAHELRLRAFAGMREVIARISDRRPLVLSVDDLQWGDADSADLLAHLLRPPEAPAFLFVGSYRREDAATSPFLRTFLRPGRERVPTTEIAVDELSDEESRVLAATLLERAGIDTGHADALARESRGSPFFLHELAAQGSSSIGARGVSLEDVLQRRIAALPDGASHLLEVVVVAGGPVRLAMAALAAQLAPGTQPATLAVLRGARLVRVMSSDAGEELDAYHDRIRETVLSAMPEVRRRELHRRLGNALESDRRVDPEELGLHFEGAGDSERAGEHYARAAENAHRALAFEHAAQLYEKALTLLEPEGTERRDLYRRLGDALSDGGRSAEAAPAFLRAAEGAERASNLELRWRAAQDYLRAGRLTEWRTVVGPVLRELGIQLPRAGLPALARIAWNLVSVRVRGLDFEERDPATLPPESALKLDVCETLASVLAFIEIVPGWVFQTVSLRLALKLGHPAHVSYAVSRHWAYRNVLNVRGDRHAEKLRERAEQLAHRVSDPVALAFFDFVSMTNEFVTGNWTQGLELARAAGTRYRTECVGRWWERDTAEFYELMALDFLGRYREFVPSAARCLREAEERGNHYFATDLRTRITYIGDLVRDAPLDAQLGVDDAISHWPAGDGSFQRYRWTEGRVNTAVYRGEFMEAREILAMHWAAFRRMFLLRVPLLRHVFLHGRGRLALIEAARSKDRSAVRRLNAKTARVGRELVRTRDAYSRGWGRLLCAGTARLEGDIESAVAHLVEAESAFDECEMRAYLAVTRRRRGELIGGDEGSALVASANAWMLDEGIVNPTAWSRMYAPGFEE